MNKNSQSPGDAPLVMVVDDTEVNRLLATAYLERMGWTVVAARDAQEAEALLAHTLPAAMLIDVRMPGLTGDRLAAKLRRDGRAQGMRLVGYTAHCQPDEVARFRRAGFDEVLLKPALMADMLRVLPPPVRAA
jgi:CheY-like chemotaxis protein